MQRYFKIAKIASKRSDLKSIHVGACLVSGGIHYGWNSRKTHPMLPKIYGSIFSTHAEMKAILKAGEKARGGLIFLFRQDKSGAIKKSRPCKGCLGFLIACGVKRIYYTIDCQTIGIIYSNGKVREEIMAFDLSGI